MKNVFFSVFMLFSLMAVSQQNYCGTVYDKSMDDRLMENKKAYFDIETRSEEWVFIPIHFHIVTKSDGSGAINPMDILEELSHMNKNYASLKMKFYLSGGFSYIKSDKLYSDQKQAIAVAQIKSNKKKFKNSVNVFIVNNIPSINSGPGRVLGYYTPQHDVLVVLKAQFGIKSKTLSHELGHFFSLAHPFYGWEEDPYDAAKHGNPVTVTNVKYFGQNFKIELMDGSNCNTTADKICDTPPDYNFGITDDGDCKLNGPILDKNKDTIVTMENNYMSYFFGCDSYVFTPMQGSAMQADVKSSKRSYIRSSYIPDTTLFDDTNGTITEPLNNTTTQFYDDVTLDWDDIAGVSSYIVRISPKAQSFNSKYYFVDGESKLVLNDLNKNKSYKWYVRAYNEGNTTGNQFGGFSFKAGEWTSGTSNVNKETELSIYPNPIQGNEIFIKANHTIGNSNIKIYNIDGKLIENIKANLNKGDNKLTLTHSNYQNGMYNIIIDSKDKQYIRKVLIEK